MERAAADAVLLLHFGFVLFAMFGGLLALRWPRLLLLHVPVFAWASWVNLAGWICPLTYLENALRRRAGDAGYDVSFVDHYIAPLVYPPGLTPELAFALGIGLPVWTLLVYGAVFWRVRQRP